MVVPGPTSACVALVGHRTTRKGHEDAAIPTQLDTDSLPEHRTRRMPDRRPLRGHSSSACSFRRLVDAGLPCEVDYGGKKGVRARRADIDRRPPGLWIKGVPRGSRAVATTNRTEPRAVAGSLVHIGYCSRSSVRESRCRRKQWPSESIAAGSVNPVVGWAFGPSALPGCRWGLRRSALGRPRRTKTSSLDATKRAPGGLTAWTRARSHRWAGSGTSAAASTWKVNRALPIQTSSESDSSMRSTGRLLTYVPLSEPPS